MKKTIFISSTFEDLKSHRAKVWDALKKYDVNIRGMEQFGARTEKPISTCLAEVEQSDVYVGIIALKLGTVDKNTEKSVTQLEYEKAHELGKEILIYMIDEKNSFVSPTFIDYGIAHDKLESFKSILKENHTVDTFTNEEDLCEKLKRRLDQLVSKKDQIEPKVDEYKEAEEVLKKFCLMPKYYSGKEIKIKLKLLGDPFSASKLLCGTFGFDYGKTVGVTVDFLIPKLKDRYLEHLIITDKLIDTFFKTIEKQKEIEIYGKLLFSEKPIEKVNANFITKTFSTLGSVYESEFTETIYAEGKMLVVLTRMIN